jgi:ribonuclease P protein component
MKKYLFRKEERLCSLKLIEQLYEQGSSFSFYPFRLIFLTSPTDIPYPSQIVISVPKRKFKKAVDRNRIKRLIRESYRHLKEDLLYPALTEKQKSLLLMIIYTGNEINRQKEIEKKLTLALERLLVKC